MPILNTIYNTLSNKGRQIKQTVNNIVNSPEMKYVKMAAPRSQIINARNQLGGAWQNYINTTYPETFKGRSNVEPYYKTYWLTPRYSEESEAAAKAYNAAYDKFAPALWDEAKYWWPYSRNYWPKWNMPSNLQNKEVTRVTAPGGTSVGNELIDATQNVAPAVVWQAPWMTYKPTPLFKEGEIKQWADIIREMQRQINLYKEEQRKLKEDREKYNAELIAMVERDWKTEARAKKKDQYEYELAQRRNALLDRSSELYNLREQYNKTLADMTKVPELINYR